jgi:hypothetical protein
MTHCRGQQLKHDKMETRLRSHHPPFQIPPVHLGLAPPPQAAPEPNTEEIQYVI